METIDRFDDAVVKYLDLIIDDLSYSLYEDCFQDQPSLFISESKIIKLPSNPFVRSICFDYFQANKELKKNLVCYQLDTELCLTYELYDTSLNEDLVFVDLLHAQIQGFYNFRQKNKLLEDSNEEILSLLPFPCALVNKDGDILIHNPLFAKLNVTPSDFVSYSNGQKIEINNKIYTIAINVIDGEEHKCLSFINEEFFIGEQQSHGFEFSTSEELGIITSSMAHELNNPIAAIFAGIAVLELSVESDEEFDQSLLEMKSSAKRCKELLEVFLGFSRRSPRINEREDMESAFERAVGLMRFRMMESNTLLNAVVAKDSVNITSIVNPSIMTMVYYIILNQFLTSFSHLRLLYQDHDLSELVDASESVEIKKLEVELADEVGRKSVRLKANYPLQLNELLQSKLLRYLLKLEKLNMDIDDGVVIISPISELS